MRLISNSVNPNDVVEETRDGDRFLVVQNVPFVRAQELSGGYVPDSEIRASTKGWDGRLLTANHPRDNEGKPVPAETKKDETAVGYAESPEYDGEYIRVDMAVNADRAEALGGHAADIVTKIENGEEFDVSSQYFPKDLPPGEYDGEYRSNVEGIQEPDSIALLPHKPGQCSMSDGCGINPDPAVVANAEVSIPVADDPVESGEDTGEDSTMTDDLDLENPDDETKRTLGERMLSALGWGTDGDEAVNEPAESGADVTPNMNDRTAELVANHGFDADNLPPEETQCFDRIYDAVTSNDEDEPEESDAEDETDDEPMTETEDEIVLTEDELEGMIEEKAQEIVANREEETEKDSLAREIVANSAEYDDVEAVTEDFPTVAALETKREQVTETGTMPGTGATANAQSDDLDDLSVGVFE